ncbi:MAG TPA: aspartate--tRNA ligase [Sphingobacteriaceae bacterium]|nr:aspartate--tRNA ligase [Sphingobacteriaceae bacterium]
MPGQADLLHRTHECGTLRREHAGSPVVLTGWVARVRDHGGVLFVDLRDRTGIVQLVFHGDTRGDRPLRPESVIGVRGEVRLREPHLVNPKLATGEVEVWVSDLQVWNESRTPPFYIEDGIDTDESVRLRYRYLDLRRPEMQRALILRHRVTKVLRDFFDARGFLEVETPMLTLSTPEGARDYLVPSRLEPGHFYALPQSPQLFKQLLMVSGLERYFQVVRCFRDEDLRADRQPEFTQVDVEMSFVEEEDVMAMVEDLMADLYREVLGVDLPRPFPRLTYDEAMLKYGTDKPDLRNPLTIEDVGQCFAETEFRVFRSVLDGGGVIRALRIPAGEEPWRRKDLDDLTAEARRWGAGGLAWLEVGTGPAGDPQSHRSSFARFLSAQELTDLFAATGAEPGDLLLMVADSADTAARVLGHLRQHIAQERGFLRDGELAFTWITDFPLLEWDEDEKRYVAVHHPFTSPKPDHWELLRSEPWRVRARAYDLVLNGVELGGGSIRIHNTAQQEQMLAALGFSQEEAKERFGFLMEAFSYGAPPHGGIALGLDRMVMLMAERQSIRDVIAFPKTAKAACLMTGAPGPVDPAQLQELHLQVIYKEPEGQAQA